MSPQRTYSSHYVHPRTSLASALTCQCPKSSQVWWMLCLSISTVFLEEERKENYITLFYNVSQADYWVFNMILPFDYRKKLSWWLSKKILYISSMNLTASLKLPAKETSSLLGKCFKLIYAWYLDIVWSPPGAIFTKQPPPPPFKSTDKSGHTKNNFVVQKHCSYCNSALL